MVTAGSGINLATDTPQAHITDYTASTSLTNPPTKVEAEAQLAAIATAINAILAALENAGILQTS